MSLSSLYPQPPQSRSRRPCGVEQSPPCRLSSLLNRSSMTSQAGCQVRPKISPLQWVSLRERNWIPISQLCYGHPKKRMPQAQVLPKKSYQSLTKMTLSREKISITHMRLRLRKPCQTGLPERTKMRSSNLKKLSRSRIEKFARIALRVTRSSRLNFLLDLTPLGQLVLIAARLNRLA